MSDQDYGYEGGYQEPMGEDRPQSNVLGVVGFVLAFCVSPVGLIVSLLALMKPPRGFAVGGVVVGVLGTIVWAAGGWFVMAFMVPSGVWVAGSVQDWEKIEAAVSQHQSSNGALPDSLDVLGLDAEALEDPNGIAWRYEVTADGSGWSLIGAGMDEQFDTPDDLTLTGDMTEDKAARAMSDAIRRYYEERFKP